MWSVVVIANETSESGSAEAESHSPVAEDANQESNEDNEEVLFVRKKKTPEAQDSIQKQEDGEEEPKEEEKPEEEPEKKEEKKKSVGLQ